MAFDESLARRIRGALARKRGIQEKKMFGGIGFLLNGNILVGVWKDSMIVRLDPSEYQEALRTPNVREFDITGKPMKGWVMVEPEGLEDDDQLKNWIEQAAKFVKTLPKNDLLDDLMTKPRDIDDYISRFSAEVQAVLRKVRETIRRAAPEATETISYQMPAFRQHGILVYFAAWKEHIGLYPPLSGDRVLEKAVTRYAGPKGNLQFPLDEPIPFDLIEQIVRLRVRQDREKESLKRSKRKRS